MDLALLVYGISLLSPIFGVLIILTIIFSAAIVISLIVSADWLLSGQEYSWNVDSKGYLLLRVKEYRKRVGMIIKFSLLFGSVTLLLVIMIPSQKTAYLMLSAYTAQKIAQDPKIQHIGEKILTIVNQKLDEYIAEVPKK